MKSFINSSIRIFFLLFISLSGFAQTKVLLTGEVYDKMKAAGEIKPQNEYIIVGRDQHTVDVKSKDAFDEKSYLSKVPSRMPASGCSCMVPVDATFSVAEFSFGTAPDYRNDDSSTPLKTFPFTFCFYGTNYTGLYINNNGNVTFDAPFGSFTSSGFPMTPTVMIAPFWADVDTRNLASGLVYYKITPTYMIIKWSNVGYYSNMVDKINDFQLIITNGTDPILPNGNNVAFCYGDMQWTTGAASGGTGGFGGSPSNVGINQGGGATFFQLGRFDQAGTAYDGPYGANDGVSYLDNDSYYFTTCAPGGNIPPVLSPYLGICDSVKICNTADTLVYTMSYSSPELSQNVVSLTATAPTLGPQFTILSTTLGQTSTIVFRVIATAGYAGNHIITVTAIDDGVTAATTITTFNIFIQATGTPPDPIISLSPAVICAGAPASTFTLANASAYDSYFWSTGLTNAPLSVTDQNVYYVTGVLNGCYQSSADSIVVHPLPTPLILGPLSTCGAGTTTLYVDSTALYPTVLWSNAVTNDSTNVLNGTYTITVTDTNGCTATSPPVTVVTSNLTMGGILTFCDNDSTQITANANPTAGTTYAWSNGPTTPSQYVTTTGTYYVTTTFLDGCVIVDSISVIANPVNPPVTGFSYTSPVCVSGTNPVLTTVPLFTLGGVYSSSPAAGISLNASTGAVNLAASTPGTYIITYNFAATTCGPAGSSSDTLVINPVIVPVLNFSYPTYCVNGGVNPLPIPGAGFTTGGTYSSTPGVAINPVTGEINLSLTPAGTYTVTYSVTGSNAVGVCTGSGSNTASVIINGVPSLTVSAEQTIWIGTSTSIYASGGTSYVWSPSQTGSICYNATCDTLTVTPPFTTLYCVLVTDGNGCKDSTCSRVVIETPCPTNRDLVIPNAFTPNGDGNNDELCLEGWDDCVTTFEIVIFARWGEKVFSSTSPHFCWDGIYKGRPLDPAVFVYFIKASYLTSGAQITDAKGVLDITKKGNISLVR